MILILKQEIREKIIQQLLGGSIHINELARKFPNNRNDYFSTYKQMVRDGELIPHRQKNRILLSLGPPKANLSFQHIMSSLPLAEKRADKILKRLAKSKPLFIRGEFKDLEKMPMKINSKNRRNLNQILTIINDLVSRSVALTYAECLDAFPKSSKETIRKYHKNCILTIQKIMNKLENQHKESDLELGSYLYYGIRGYNHLTTLLFLSRK